MRIEVYDSTLRDGAQAEGISYSLEDKLLIARRLDALGVHYIEGGWPNPTNPKDSGFFPRGQKTRVTGESDRLWQHPASDQLTGGRRDPEHASEGRDRQRLPSSARAGPCTSTEILRSRPP